MAKKYVTASLSAQNTFSDNVELVGSFDFSLSGVSDSTITFQRSYDSGSTWKDVDTFTANTELVGTAATRALYRFGIKTGDYGSDTVVGIISQG